MQSFQDFAQALYVAAKALQLYSVEHPRGAETLSALHRATTGMMEYQDRLQIVSSHGRLFVDRKQIPLTNAPLQNLVRILNERKLNGVVLLSGISEKDLLGLVQLLNMKPQRIEESGGAVQVLADLDVDRVRLSHVRFEELVDGEEVVDAATAATLANTTVGDTPLHVLLNDLFKPLMQALKTTTTDPGEITATKEPVGFHRAESKPLATSGTLFDPRKIVPFDLSLMEKRLLESGVLNQPEFLEAFSDAIVKQDVASQANILMSRETLPAGPLREVLDFLAPQLVLNIVSGMASDSAKPAEEIPEVATFLYSQLQPRDRSLDRLRSRLETAGIDRDELEELLGAISWENLSFEAKMERLGDQRFLFDLRADRLLKFMRDLLLGGKSEEFVQILERYGAGLFAESADFRRNILEGVIRMVSWGKDSALPPAVETALQKLILTHFLREPDTKLQQRTNTGLSQLLGQMMAGGRSDRALRALTNLSAGVAASPIPWKKQAFESLLQQVATEHVPAVIPQLYGSDTASNDIVPVLVFIGAPAASQLIDELAKEEDRSHRGRIVKAIKTIGRPALLPLRHALSSPTWYLVRNALNILGDLGGTELIDEVAAALDHPDGRVKRAAGRALSKMGGDVAESALVGALTRGDAELQGEILFCLASLKAESAVPAIAELTKGKRIGGDDVLRERAIDTLGQIGSARAIPLLEEIIRKKGILTATEPPEIRVAAARALANINTPEARVVIRKAADSEPSGAVREQIEKILESAT
jgi:HEAT repeat protein